MPGVQNFQQIDEDSYRLMLKVGVSFIKGKFNLKVKVTEKFPPSHAELTGNGTGSGSSATFHGICDIAPVSENSSKLEWQVNVEIGGLAASVGGRLVQSASEKYIKELVDALKQAVEMQKKSAV